LFILNIILLAYRCYTAFKDAVYIGFTTLLSYQEARQAVQLSSIFRRMFEGPGLE